MGKKRNIYSEGRQNINYELLKGMLKKKMNIEELRKSLTPVEKGKMLEKCVHYFIHNKMKREDTPNPFNGYTGVMGRGIDNIIYLKDEKIAVECKNNAKTTYYSNKDIDKQFVEYFKPYYGKAKLVLLIAHNTLAYQGLEKLKEMGVIIIELGFQILDEKTFRKAIHALYHSKLYHLLKR